MVRQPRATTSSGAICVGWVLCALGLAACAPRTTREVTAPRPAASADWAVPRDSASWTLDESASELRVLVYRSGTLARLGHNHVLRARRLEARAWGGQDGSLVDSGVELRIPVAQLAVDDPVDRALSGPEFAAPVSDEARSGTLANLTRPEVLDAATFPDLRVRATVVSVVGTAAIARARVTLRAATSEIDLPLTLARDDGGVTASGQLALRQSDFGIAPFSIAGGAIAVADEVQVHFNLRFTPDKLTQ